MRGIVSRVARLEARTASGERAVVWRQRGETAEQASERHVAQFPETRGFDFLVIGWQEDEPA